MRVRPGSVLAAIAGGLAGASIVLAAVVSGAVDVSTDSNESVAAAGAGTTADASTVHDRVRDAVVSILNGNSGGTGVVVSDRGDIVTNAHVVGRAESVRVRLADGTTLNGRVLRADTRHDLALVRASIPHAKLTVAPLGDSDQLRAGQPVVAIGQPFGLDGTVTQGIISAVDRRFNGQSMLQIDAAINPGNSGGPLLDMAGRVVGINTALENPTGQRVFVGIGFAVPSNTIQDVLGDLLPGNALT